MVVSALLRALGALVNVAAVAALVYYIFAVLGMSVMLGRFWSCRQILPVSAPAAGAEGA